MKLCILFFLLNILCAQNVFSNENTYDLMLARAKDERSIGNKTAQLNSLFNLLIQEPQKNSKLYFLLGQTAYELHEYGLATAFFVQSLEFTPRNELLIDTIHNLQQKTQSSFSLFTFFSKQEAYITLLFVTSIGILLYMLYLHTKNSIFQRYAYIALCLACTLVLFTVLVFNCTAKKAVVIRPIYAQQSLLNSTPLFFIPEGHAVALLDVPKNGWIYIEYGEYQRGYIPTSFLKLLTIPTF